MVLGRRFFPRLLVVRLGIVLGTIFALALTATVSATIFAELSSGKAAAINVASSLRMQSYWITVQALLASEKDRSVSGNLRSATSEFERRLLSPQVVDNIPLDPNNPARKAYDDISSQWFGKAKSLATRATLSGPIARGELVAEMTSFVQDVDRLVYLLEQELEQRIQQLKAVQGATLFFTIMVMIVALYLLHMQVVIPMKDLLQCARRVRARDFATRARNVGTDELGQLGQSFNFMVADLSRSYAELEARVEEKTEELARSNMSLEVLYNVTRRLAEKTLTEAALKDVTQAIEKALDVEVVAICVREDNELRGFPILRKSSGLCSDNWTIEEKHCVDCMCDWQAGIRFVASIGLLAVPLTEGGKPYGVMLIGTPKNTRLEEWKSRLITTIGHHIGAALAAARRSEEKGRLALIEERSAIARELHDSLAQSLSYLNIQVARLRSSLSATDKGTERPGDAAAPLSGELAAIIDELKLGLNNAYRQLRELLTTFRIGMHSKGLSTALQEAIREFSRRADTEFRLHNRLIGHELNAGEQVHVLQVVREALTNVVHHAHAPHADVCLVIERGCVRVTVDDDGLGIPDETPPEHHYGLAIMHDRAASLGGQMCISRRPEGGTRVELVFEARGPYGRERRMEGDETRQSGLPELSPHTGV